MRTQRNPYAIPMMIAALGLGFVVYHAEAIYRFEALPDAVVAEQARAQLDTLEARRGPHLSPITGERRDALLERIEAEIRGTHDVPHEKRLRWFFLGLGMLVIGSGHAVATRMTQ